jgi:diguanylate cyclase (GGDEF)-like protein/PAS domain S-box-containing protein
MSLFNDPEIYRAVLECMQNGVYLVDRSERIQFWNAGAERITGYLRQDVLGHFCRDFFAPQEQEGQDGVCEFGGALASVLRDGRPAITELTLRHKGGHQVSLNVRSLPIRNREGTIIGVVESFDDDHRITYSERRHNKLKNYGCIDEATGVLTRSFVETHLRENLMTFSEHRVPFSILCVEVDGLATFRAKYGASAVAAMLRTVALTLESSIRPTDFLGLHAENRLLTVLAECSATETKRVGDRLLRMVHNTKFKWWGDHVSLTASFGGTAAREGDTEESLMARAEKSLADSIAAGGNQVKVAD